MLKTGCTRRIILGTFLILLIAGCYDTNQKKEVEGQWQGTITVSGAWALYPLMVQWADEFQDDHSLVKFDISAGGAGKGMTDVLAGAVDIGMVSRRIYPEEEAKGAFWVAVAGARVVPLDVNNNGHVDEDERCDTKEQAVRSVAEDIYPSPPARDLNLVTKGQPSGLVFVFMEWVLTEGQQYIDQAGYVALPSKQIEAEMQKLEPSS